MNAYPPKPTSKDLPSFTLFYDQYAPKLWSLIVLANLSTTRSEDILINTMIIAWQQPDSRWPAKKHVLTWLIGLAYTVGLPTAGLLTRIKAKV
ncbi:hypothetical protein SAMN05216167_11269 [Spirosoma endophyticum]|uniref:Uncharacterized protein n=1 Tax=Spirosoma endophyticum TaxID=662367 RepID=A0A1I1ZC97_9BACT|nr:hypothetical protein SAMN05216167_11269 [Spirosoma endophyticum]